MLVGPDAPIVFDRKVRATYMANVYDFYKPELSSEYPTVDGPLSNQCYLQAVDKCFQLYFEKANKQKGTVVLDNFDAILFHAPYCKLVQKSIARLFLLDFLQNPEKQSAETNKQLEKYKFVLIERNFYFYSMLRYMIRTIKLEDTYNDRELEKVLLGLSKRSFDTKTDPSLMLARCVGNTYTASLYGCLISYLLRYLFEGLLNCLKL